MRLRPLRFPERLPAAGHLAGFLSASFLIEAGFRAFGGLSSGGTFASSVPAEMIEGLVPEGILPSIVLAAILEELFYRGLLFEGIRRFKGVPWAIGLSAALFAVAHAGFNHAVAAGLLGLYLGMLRASRGLMLPLIAHAANNALAWTMASSGIVPWAGLEGSFRSVLAAVFAGLALGLIGISLATLRQEIRSPTFPEKGPRGGLQRIPRQDENPG
ncbi:MAG: lysostaphin resistance A-like protein [Myxococcota bacterium]